VTLPRVLLLGRGQDHHLGGVSHGPRRPVPHWRARSNSFIDVSASSAERVVWNDDGADTEGDDISSSGIVRTPMFRS
jgi:hypothetical protein